MRKVLVILVIKKLYARINVYKLTQNVNFNVNMFKVFVLKSKGANMNLTYKLIF